jgi:Protein of unknown function (DUF4065)
MPLFPRIDPDARALIAYIVARSSGRGITLNRTRLVKLLYLVDIERVRTRRDPLTRLRWRFYHYGPYAFELIDTLRSMEGVELIASPWKDNVLYRGAPGAPDAQDWNAGTKILVDSVADRFAPLDLNELLDYVYFHTGPMIDAKRGDWLDLSLARNDPRERPHVPLRPPARPADIEDRLARWRPRDATLRSVALDPPGLFLQHPDDELGGEGVRGVLRTPDDTQL